MLPMNNLGAVSLFDYILPIFSKKTGIDVRVVAVGTGQALKVRNGDGDVLLVHAKPAEEKFVFDGFGVMRQDVMFNDFVIVGPAADPKVGGMKNAAARALQDDRERQSDLRISRR